MNKLLFALVAVIVFSCSVSSSRVHQDISDGVGRLKKMHAMMFRKVQSMGTDAHKTMQTLNADCTANQTAAHNLAALPFMLSGDIMGAFKAMCAAGLKDCNKVDENGAPDPMAEIYCLEVDGVHCFSEIMSSMGGEEGEESTGPPSTCNLATTPCGCPAAEEEAEEERNMAPFCTPCGRRFIAVMGGAMGGGGDQYPDCDAMADQEPDLAAMFDAMCKKNSVTNEFCLVDFSAMENNEEKKLAPMCGECILPVFNLMPTTPGKDMLGIVEDLCRTNGQGSTCAAQFDSVPQATKDALENCPSPDAQASELTTCTPECKALYVDMTSRLGCCTERVLRMPFDNHVFDDKDCTMDSDCDQNCEFSDYCLEICMTEKAECKMAKVGKGADKSALPLFPKIAALSGTPFMTYLTTTCDVSIPTDCDAPEEEKFSGDIPIGNLKPTYYTGLSGTDKDDFDECVGSRLAVAAGVPVADISFTIDGNVVKDIEIIDVTGFGANAAFIKNAPDISFPCLPDAAKEDANQDFESEFFFSAASNLSVSALSGIILTLFAALVIHF